MSQRALRNAKITNRILGKLVDLFALEVPALNAAKLVGVNRNTVTLVYREIRERIARACEREAPLGHGEHELDESYFGGVRKGLRGRGAAGKVIVFGILKRNGRVYTRPVPNVERATKGYKHYRINHDREFARGKRNHINGIENFWGFAKTKLRRYYGIDRNHFRLFLKEMGFRFNHRNEDLHK